MGNCSITHCNNFIISSPSIAMYGLHIHIHNTIVHVICLILYYLCIFTYFVYDYVSYICWV